MNGVAPGVRVPMTEAQLTDSPATADTPANPGATGDHSAAQRFVETLGARLSSGDLGMPSFPDAVIRIRGVLSAPNSTIAQVAQVASTEPVFTAKLIRMANSVVMRRGEESVTDVANAIARIGYDTVRNVAVAMATRQIMKAKSQGPLKSPLKKLWQHSVKVAALSYVLAEKMSRVKPDEALLAGLVHDIGKFYILVHAKEEPDLFEDTENFDQIMYEWHTMVGRAILEEWGFPEEITLVADEHEVLDREHVGEPDLLDIVSVANLLVNLRSSREHPFDIAESVPAFARLRLSAESSSDFLKESDQRVRSIARALSRASA